MRRVLPMLVLALLALALPSSAVASENLIANPSLEEGTDAPVAWSQSSWGKNQAQFEWSTDAHTGQRSVRVEVTDHEDGDAKWMPNAVDVAGNRYYRFSVWYKANANSAVSVYYETADGTGKWANLFAGIPASEEWTQYQTGFTMPANAVRAQFVIFLPRNGFLQTDDYELVEEQVPAGFSRPMVSLTFDDGSQGFYQDALPLLRAKGFKTTQYVPTEGLGTNSFLMTPAQLRELADEGHEIGSHTISHPDLTTLDDAALARELRDSKSLLESVVKRPVKGLAYPFGAYDARVIAAAKAAGYESGRSVEDGYNGLHDLEPFGIRGQNILDTTTIEDFKTWVDHAKAHNYWLVIIYHEVVPDGEPVGPYDTTVSEFSKQLDYLEQSGVDVVTAGEAFAAAQEEIHGPTPTPTPDPTPDPTPTPSPTPTPNPAVTPDPTPSAAPTTAPQPAVTPVPSATPAAKADTKPPRITIRSPKARTYRRGATVTIRFKCTDASGCLRPKATLRRPGAKARAIASGRRLKLTRPGRYVLRVTVKDRAGNAATHSLVFRVSARR